MYWFLVSSSLALFIYYFLVKPQLYWYFNNVKQGPPIPLFGDNLKLLLKQESVHEMIIKIYNRFRDVRYCGMYQTITPTLMIRDPDLIKKITVRDFDHFVDHRSFAPDDLEPLWSRTLFALKGDSWKEMRATLSPAFTASKMRKMFVLMEKSAQQYVDFYLELNKEHLDIELKDSLSRFANDVMANCGFGLSTDSLKQPENEFFKHAKDATDISGFWRNFKFWLNTISPKITSTFKLHLFKHETTNFLENTIKNIIAMREEQNIIRPDVIHLLMEASKGRLKYEESKEVKSFATAEESNIWKKYAPKTEMTEFDITAQALVLLIGAVESTSTAISFICYELAVHPEVQEKLRQEVDEAFKKSNGQLTYDVLCQMKYMDMAVTENLRKNPPSPFIDCLCTKAYTIEAERDGEKPIYLEPGSTIFIPISGLHHDEQYYPNPEKFDPERFSDENKGNIKPYTFAPFGFGPRNCIGSRFGLMELKTVLFHILRKFELTVIDKTVIPMKYGKGQFSLAIEGGFWVGFKIRKTILLF